MTSFYVLGILSVLAAFIWAICNVIDKYVLEKWVKMPIVPLIIFGVAGFITGILIYFFHGFSVLSYKNICIALLSGVISILATTFYFKAIKLEEISRVIPLYSLSPLFTLILATLFLGEIFSFMKYIGILLLVAGAILISLKKSVKISFKKSFILIMASVLLFASTNIILKYLLNFADFWTIFAYGRIGYAFILMPILFFNFKHLSFTVKKHGKKVVFVMFLSESLNVVAIILFMMAMSIGYVSLVSSLGSIQPFFVLLITLILSIFFPKILKEEIGRSTLLRKFIAIALMFIGVILIT